MSFFRLLRITCCIACVLLLLASGFIFFYVYSWRKAFDDLDLGDWGTNYQYSLETYFSKNEEKFNKIDSIAQEMIRSNSKGILDDSAKRKLESLFIELYPYRISPIYFYPKLIQISMYQPDYQPDSTKICHWGYIWTSTMFIDDSENHWISFNKVYGDYSTEMYIHKWRLSKNRGWYFYREGCY